MNNRTTKGAWGKPISATISDKGENVYLKQISKAEFAWLYEKYFRKSKYKNWTKTCVAKGRSKRGKYYVEDRWYRIVKQQNIV